MEIFTTTGALIGKAAVTACVTKIINAASSAGQTKTQDFFSKFKADKIAQNYADKIISKITTFKTLNGNGKDVKLNDIYYPLSISKVLTGSRFAIKIDSDVTLKYDGCICITGNAGQGKTTIMRKLFVEELILGERFPFLLTLRDFDYTKGYKCSDLLLEHLKDCGIECTLSDVCSLLSSGKVIIFFDGFDEIPPTQRIDAIKLVEGLHFLHSCPSVITTRPDTELVNVVGLEQYNVNFLDGDEVKGIVRKLVEDKDYAESIIKTLDGNDFLNEAINTPILVSIFILTYDSYNDEPQNITDFYGALFLSLIFKHDKSKIYKRVRKTSLNNNRLEECFASFSYLSLAEGVSTFNDVGIRQYFYQANELLDENESPEDLMHDIIDGTNIIAYEGFDRYVYIHRSIQEYFAAKCISNFDDDSKKEYYEQALSDDDTSLISNLNVLRMLSSIDKNAFSEFYISPLLLKYGLLTASNIIQLPTPEKFVSYVNNCEVGYKTNSDGSIGLSLLSNAYDHISVDQLALDKVFDIISYENGTFSSLLYELLIPIASDLAGKYVQKNNIEVSEFFSHIGTIESEFNNNYIKNSDGDGVIVLLSDVLDGDDIPDGILDALRNHVCENIKRVQKYLNDNFFLHKKSSKRMIDILRKNKNKNF